MGDRSATIPFAVIVGPVVGLVAMAWTVFGLGWWGIALTVAASAAIRVFGAAIAAAYFALMAIFLLTWAR